MAPPSSASDPSSSLNPFAHNTVDYTLDHTCVHSPIKPDTAGDLAILARTHARAEEAMRACAIQILQQPIEMLKTGVVHDKELCAQSHGVSGSTVGKHLRHVLDHFRLFLDALESTSKGNIPFIDYDRRLRAVSIETSSSTALDEFVRTQDRMKQVFTYPFSDGIPMMDQPVILQATTPIIQKFKSTFGREIWFICLHSIHHFALARVILSELGLADQLSKEFGVAPSTLVYRSWGRSQKEQSDKPTSKAKL